jgi:hypothetical protein
VNPSPSTPKASGRAGGIALSVFGLVFGAGGLVAFWFAASTVVLWTRMASWEAVPAQLESLNLEEHGSDPTTYKTAATFRYRYAGRDYTSSRVAISSTADNIGDFQHRVYDELRSAQAAGTPVTAYVNPANAADATLNRELRLPLLAFELVFALAFGGVGFGTVFAARFGARRVAQERTLRSRFASEPWRWRTEWTDGRIRGTNRTRAYTALVFAALWNVISAPAAALAMHDAKAALGAKLIVMLFPLVGVGLAAWAVRAWWQWRRFGGVTLVLQRTPVALGGRLQGTLRVDTAVPVDTAFRLELCCSERRTGGGRNETSERLLWQGRVTVPRTRCEMTSDYTAIPVDIAVPGAQPATTAEPGAVAIHWHLDVTGECPGPDFWSRFELPVFDVGEVRGTETPAESVTTDASERPDRQRLADIGIDYTTLPGGAERWIFRRARHAAAAASISVFTAVWSGIAIWLYTVDAPFALPLVFGGFDLLLLWAALQMWLAEYRVTLDKGVLTLAKRGILSGKPVEIPRQWIRGATARRGMQAGNKLYYDVRIETADRTYTAANEIDDFDVATWLAAYWRAGGRDARYEGSR